MIIIDTNDNRKWTLYEIIFPNKMAYVGITSQKLLDRWGYNGNGYKTQPVYKAICEFGWDNLEKNIIASDLDKKTARELETKYINKYKELNGVYNKTDGGECGSLLSAEFIIDGKSYSSKDIAAMSNVEGINYHDITTRVNHHGWNLEDAINKEKIKKNQKIRYKGSDYSFDDLLKFSKVDDLTIDDLYCRINNHKWDIERALTQPKNVKNQPHGVGERKYFYNNMWCNSYDLFLMRKDKRIKQSDIVSRIERSHWSIEKAISKPPKNMNRKYKYNGEYYTSKELEAISPVGLMYNTIVSRIKLGWSVKDAVEKPVLENCAK